MFTLSIANQKGGVGKTAISVHQAFHLAGQGAKVLFIDNDPQANGSYTLEKSDLVSSSPFETLDLYSESKLPTLTPKSAITLIKANRSLAKAARYDAEAPHIFRENVQNFNDQFDYCIMDNAPTLGLVLIASLVSSDFVYTPIELEDYSIQGLNDLIQTIDGVKKRHNSKLNFLGIIPNRLNSRDNQQKENMEKLLKAFPKKIIKTAIAQRGSIAEALQKGLPVWKLQKTAAKVAAKEILEALNFLEQQMNIKTPEAI